MEKSEFYKLKHEHADEIIIVRHGQTARNTMHRIGRYIANRDELGKSKIISDREVPLDDIGILQAKCMGRALSILYPECRDCSTYFHSGYERTKQTLVHMLGELGFQKDFAGRVQEQIELREREPGYHFNMTATEINTYFPWYLEYAKTTGPFFERPPGGESIADVCSRIHMFLNSLRRAHAREKIFVVAHGGVMLAFRFWLEKHSLADAKKLFTTTERVQNCGILIFKRNHENRKFTAQIELINQITDKFHKLLADEEKPSP
jgi:broad specificity phosphatase PhoE